MSYILFLSSKEKLRKYLNSLNKEEKKSCYFFASLQDDITREDIPKKCPLSSIAVLIPPPDIVTNYIITKNEAKYQDKYYRYLTRPLCHAALNKIARTALIDDYNVVVCISDVEAGVHVHKIIRKAFENLFPQIDTFTFKDWKEDPEEVMNYKQSDKLVIVKRILDDAKSVGKILKDLDSCSDRYDERYFD